MKTILFVGGGREALGAIAHARFIGYRTLCSDRDPEALGLAAAHKGLVADIYDPQQTIDAIEQSQERINGVLSVAHDCPLTVATVAQYLKSAGVPIETARLSMDKAALKLQLRRFNIPSAQFFIINEYKDYKKALSSIGYPAIVKPVDSRGARGVSLLISPTNDRERAYNEALSYSKCSKILVERYLAGRQYSVESIIVEGRVRCTVISKRNYSRLFEFSPYVIEDGGELPVRLSSVDEHAIALLMTHLAEMGKVLFGTIKADLVFNSDTYNIIECHYGRISGGLFATHEVPLSSGIDFIKAACDLATSYIVQEDLKPKYAIPIVQRYLFIPEGHLEWLNVPQWCYEHFNVRHLEVWRHQGDEVPPMNCHPSRSGVILTAGDSIIEAERLAEFILNSIEYTVRSPNGTTIHSEDVSNERVAFLASKTLIEQ